MNGSPGRTDAIDAEAWSLADLRRMVFEGGGPLGQPLALMLLGRKRYPGKEADLARLLMDDALSSRMRSSAALELGRLGTPEAVGSLEHGLALDDDVALRGVLEALALVRIDRVPPGIDRLVERSGPLGEAARRTWSLITHRLGLPGPSLGRPESTTMRPIEISAADAQDVEQAIAALAGAAPALRLVADGASTLRCAGQSLMFVACDGGDTRIDVAQALARPAEVAVVAVLNEREFRHWSLRYRVVTEPLSDDEIRIVVATTKGEVALEGVARTDGERATFRLRSVDGAGMASIEIDGTFDAGRVTFSRARSSAGRSSARGPAAVDRPRSRADASGA